MDAPVSAEVSTSEETVLTTETGVEEASRHSTGIPEENDEEGAKPQPPKLADTPDVEYPAQPREASRVLLKGCSRQQSAGCACPGEELDKLVLLEGDRNINRAEQLDAYLCAKHGMEYVMLINNKRCSRPGCWRRGSLWGQDGKWLLECSSRMKDYFKGPPPQPKPTITSERTTPVLTTEKLRPNWGKLPDDVDPIASSNHVPGDGLPTEGA